MLLLGLMFLLLLDLRSLGLLLLLLQLLRLQPRPQENMCQGSYVNGLRAPALMHHLLNLIDGEAAGLTIDHLSQGAGAMMIVDLLHLEVQGRRGRRLEFLLVVARSANCGGSLANRRKNNFGFDRMLNRFSEKEKKMSFWSY